MKRLAIAAALLAGLGLTGTASADLAPPTGYILDVAAITPLTSREFVFYTTTFTADSNATFVSFLFRRDPSYFSFDDASVTLGASGPNLLANPGFELGPVDSQNPVGWGNFQQTSGIPATGIVNTGAGRGGEGPNSGLYFWDDGSVGAYDGIYQKLATVAGSTYTLYFYLANPDNGAVYSQTGNGIDVLAYAGDALPDGTVVTAPAPTPPTTGVPEPESIALLGLGSLAMLGARRKRRNA